MAKDADEALLERLGVTAASTDDVERLVLSKVERDVQSDTDYVEGSDNVEAALTFLQEDGSHNLALPRRARIEGRLSALDKEIDAVLNGLQIFEQPDSRGEKVAQQEKQKKQVGRAANSIDSGDASVLHLALAKDRLKNLKRNRKELVQQLSALKERERPRGVSNEAEKNQSLLAPSSSHAKLQGKGKENLKAKAVSFLEDDDFDAALDAASGFVETEREKLIRLGVVTPFDKVKGFERKVQAKPAGQVLSKEEDELVKRSIANAAASMAAIIGSRPTTKLLDVADLPKLEPPTQEFRHLRAPLKRTTTDEDKEKPAKKARSITKRKRPQPDRFWRNRKDDRSDADEMDVAGNRDEKDTRRHRLLRKTKVEDGVDQVQEDDGEIEEGDAVLDGGFKIPSAIYIKLFDYQKTGVKWLWELHCQKAGGIIGDEMGLGKTIQVISFLGGLHYSNMYSPSIIVCPVTLLRQWKREVKKWYPQFKAEILHDSAFKVRGCKPQKKTSDSEDTDKEEDSEEDEEKEVEREMFPTKGIEKWESLIRGVVQSKSGLLITTYEQLRLVREKLLDVRWGYAVLDEGHRIRNPDAETTLICKQLQTVHRIIMTGAPIQNRLTELWSLFDFVFPGKLGVLPVFQAQFSLPIQIGGYANATPLQVSTAYRCAVVLRDLILPYLLRRLKCDVNANLPKKTEQVLFCSLSTEQRTAYRAFLASSEVEQIFEGSRNSLYGIDILRKICNHPDLLEREHRSSHPDYGNPERSGKLKLVSHVLSLWKTQGQRVLVFAQTQQMLDILQNYVEAQGYIYRRMDGSTPVKQRMALIDEFNDSDHVFVFILTTKVGGLGTNLVGANRVIIFDPDWNPSTDMQARERAWRIGQCRDVVIYRLITRGTIEEKVYHRQIYKHFLTNKILRDPQQRRFFKAKDMRDLFTLQDDMCGNQTETSTIFAEAGGNIKLGEQGLSLEEVVDAKSSDRKHRLVEKGKRIDLEDYSGSEQLGTDDKVKGVLGNETHEEESRVLKSLFEANGVHSAMDHDAILAVNETEKAKVDQEAARVAHRAAEALRDSRMLRASENIAVPTWTGRNGAAGAPAAVRRRFGSQTSARLAPCPSLGAQARPVQDSASEHPSSVRLATGSLAGSSAGKALSSGDLLNRMHERRMGALGAGLDIVSRTTVQVPTTSSKIDKGSTSIQMSVPGSESPTHWHETLRSQISTFIQKNGGSVPSGKLVEHFRAQILPKDVPRFKQILKETASLQKGASGLSQWIVKENS